MQPFTLRGSIVDSWVERYSAPDDERRLVLQVAPRERPRELVIVEAEPSLVPDSGWLEDLGSNLCHGSPVSAVGLMNRRGWLAASELVLER
jgi:hypothetical protein